MTSDRSQSLQIGSAPPQAATPAAMGLAKRRIPMRDRFWQGNTGPVLVVVLVLVAVWYLAAVLANWRGTADAFERAGEQRPPAEIAWATLQQERPVLPAPHQIVVELKKTVVDAPVTSRRSLVNHAWVTLSSTLVGFAMGALLGIVLAVLIVHVRTLERSLMPWIISSQTIPILAIAPIVIVVLGSIGITGLIPKAIISAYLCFFPVAIGMVKGLTSPDVMQRDLMRTYSASAAQTFWKLRLPASLPFLFAGLKVAIAISLVGAIVGELPTGAQAGLGARLLAGSYYGQTIQIWAALFMAAILASLLVAAVGIAERRINRRMGVRP
jgi:NitT/TauT family transport system permease protein